MKNITFEGISTLQRLHLCWQIRKQIGRIVLSAMDSVMKDITENKERIEYGKDSAFYC